MSASRFGAGRMAQSFRRAPLLARNRIINPPIGRPISVFTSCRSKALSESPTRFTASTPMASRRPHSAFLARPTAARPQAAPTTAISAMDVLPILCNSTRASGFIRQISSRNPPGNASASIVTRHIKAPAAKKIMSNVVPTNRRFWFTHTPKNSTFAGFKTVTDSRLGFDQARLG